MLASPEQRPTVGVRRVHGPGRVPVLDDQRGHLRAAPPAMRATIDAECPDDSGIDRPTAYWSVAPPGKTMR